MKLLSEVEQLRNRICEIGSLMNEVNIFRNRLCTMICKEEDSWFPSLKKMSELEEMKSNYDRISKALDEYENLLISMKDKLVDEQLKKENDKI
jgi:hypothetical protein